MVEFEIFRSIRPVWWIKFKVRSMQFVLSVYGMSNQGTENHTSNQNRVQKRGPLESEYVAVACEDTFSDCKSD